MMVRPGRIKLTTQNLTSLRRVDISYIVGYNAIMKKYSDPPKFKPEDIRLIRKEKGLSQRDLASYLGVSQKAVEAWEYGQRTPSGAACRLLSLLQLDDAPRFDRTNTHYLIGRKLHDEKTKLTAVWTQENGVLFLQFKIDGEDVLAECGQLIDKESEYLWHKQFGKMAIQRAIRKRRNKKDLLSLIRRGERNGAELQTNA